MKSGAHTLSARFNCDRGQVDAAGGLSWLARRILWFAPLNCLSTAKILTMAPLLRGGNETAVEIHSAQKGVRPPPRAGTLVWPQAGYRRDMPARGSACGQPSVHTRLADEDKPLSVTVGQAMHRGGDAELPHSTPHGAGACVLRVLWLPRDQPVCGPPHGYCRAAGCRALAHLIQRGRWARGPRHGPARGGQLLPAGVKVVSRMGGWAGPKSDADDGRAGIDLGQLEEDGGRNTGYMRGQSGWHGNGQSGWAEWVAWE
eukprot:351999-Chlamydomonas_euryale.AAC.3